MSHPTTIDLTRLPLPTDTDPHPHIPAADIHDIKVIVEGTQGHILEKHCCDHLWNLLLRFNGEKATVLSRLGTLRIASTKQLQSDRREIRTKLDAGHLPDHRNPVCFLGLSATGVQYIYGDLSNFSTAFQHGYRSRTNEKLGFRDQDWEQHWLAGYFDAVLVCAGEDPDKLLELHQTLRSEFGSDITITVEKAAVMRPPHGLRKSPAVEHFGFADGISQPGLLTNNGQTARYVSDYHPAAPLQSVLVNDPLAHDPTRAFGSYMAYLKIEQDVDKFKKTAQELSATPPAGVTALDYAESLMVGRLKDGTPLAGARAGNNNDFSRSDDPAGNQWHFGSHICKMNPRDGIRKRPIMRRGMTYDDGVRKGLIFQSFQADLEFQFETLLSSWANNPNHPANGAGADPLIQRQTTTPPQGSWPASATWGFVTIRGGEYFFFPSIATIDAWAKH